MHQTRRQIHSDCKSTFDKLAHLCSLRAYGGNSSGAGQSCQSSYGIDPVFNAYSTMYDADVSERAADYYNVSAASCERSFSGVPRAFFARPVAGVSQQGFPVLFGVRPGANCSCHYAACVQIGT